ncbi:ribonuclease H-like domain-containing protein [Tanacetum coccineum]
MFLSQCKYATQILKRARMVDGNPGRTPVDTESKLGADGDPVFDPTFAADHGLQLYSSSTTSLVAYSDADWVGCPTTRRSTWGYYLFIGNNLLSWSSKRQLTLSRSSDEAVYRCVVNPVVETFRVLNVPSRYQYADIFTKGLPSALFEEFCTSLSVRCPSVQTAEEC